MSINPNKPYHCDHCEQDLSFNNLHRHHCFTNADIADAQAATAAEAKRNLEVTFRAVEALRSNQNEAFDPFGSPAVRLAPAPRATFFQRVQQPLPPAQPPAGPAGAPPRLIIEDSEEKGPVHPGSSTPWQSTSADATPSQWPALNSCS